MDATKIHAGSIVRRARNILFSKLDDELLAIDGQEGNCYSLNASAGRAWELICDPLAVGDLCERLCLEFSVDREACERDILELFQHLSAAGLVRVSDGAAE